MPLNLNKVFLVSFFRKTNLSDHYSVSDGLIRTEQKVNDLGSLSGRQALFKKSELDCQQSEAQVIKSVIK